MTKPNIAERIVKPEQCALVFGIPLCRKDFFNDQTHLNKSFAKKYHWSWDKYVKELIYDFDLIKPRLIEKGVVIYPGTITFEKFGTLFSAGFDVIILFSHWERDAIEFYDGLVDYRAIVETIPESFDGFLDLSVCSPYSLVIELRRDRQKGLIRQIKRQKEKRDEELIPCYWLAFYLALFTHLKACDRNYLQAVEDVIAGFRKKMKRKSYT